LEGILVDERDVVRNLKIPVLKTNPVDEQQDKRKKNKNGKK